jgi:N-acetylglucosaminyldiphosphoundecaprenol N-acetyl-beta-D-mannosaminyltransferase
VRAKVSGVDLAARCCALSAEKGWRLFFFGAAPGVAEEAAARIRARHPGANIAGFRDGFFQPEDEPRIVAEIRAARPDILLVALGIPKQEKFISRHKAAPEKTSSVPPAAPRSGCRTPAWNGPTALPPIPKRSARSPCCPASS